MRFCLAVLMGEMVLGVSAPAQDSETALVINHWISTRIRKTTDASNVVESAFTITNRTKEDITELSIQVSYQDVEAKELKVSAPVKFPRLAAGATQEVSIQTDWTPAYDTYEIRATYRTRQGIQRAQWFGRGTSGQPIFIPPDPPEGDPKLVVLGEAVWSEKPGTPVLATFRLRNLSATPIEQLAAKVTFFEIQGKTRKPVGTWNGLLGDGKLAGGAEKIAKVEILHVPRNYADYKVEFTYATVERPSEFSRWSGGVFSKQPAVEAAQWRFKRPANNPNDLNVSAKVRNGLDEAVQGVTIFVKFIRKDGAQMKVIRQIEIEMLEEIPAGAIVTVEASLKDFRDKFDEISRELTYQLRE